ncbi:MAG: hypothetical protein GXY77_03240 [Fibrobacter sp.]|nr:hypothetical protein [Fibrobacter sp.]
MITKLKLVSFILITLSIQHISYSSDCDTMVILGKQWIECTYSKCPEDSITITFEDNVLRRKKIYYACRDSGLFLYFSEKGDTLTKSYFIGKKTIGVLQQWHFNGKVKILENYNDSGQKHGLCEYWREDGARKDSIVYHNGNIIELRAYFLNGKVRHWIKKVDKDSYKTLEAFYYDTSGAVCGEIKNGNGTYILWSDDAKERWIETYKNGEEVASRKLEPNENPDWK